MKPAPVVRIPDPLTEAKQEVAVRPNLAHFIDLMLDRVFKDDKFIDPDSFLEGIEEFHQERMAKIPSRARYPEAQPWVDFVLARDRHLRELTGLSGRQMAIHRSLGDYRCFRGTLRARPKLVEKCRVVYLPETNRGQLHIKNVDDPAIEWKPDPNPPRVWQEELVMDGVGSGLHIDDEPDEIFPLPVHQMVRTHCNDVPAAVDFFTRYSKFWSGGNYVVRDKQKRSVAIEKASRNFIEVFPPDPTGGSHVSGMVCRDPQSPQGRYVTAKRQQFLDKFKVPKDCLENAFWGACDRAEQKLAGVLNKPGRRTVEEILTLFTTPWPEGLNKTGMAMHPSQTANFEYTLVTLARLLDEAKTYRWQRDQRCRYPANPEIFAL